MHGDDRNTFSDQTGQFPNTLRRGAKYIMVMYNSDSNAILVEPLKSRAEQELFRATTKLHKYLTARGLKLSFQIFDNECPELMENYFQTNNIAF